MSWSDVTWSAASSAVEVRGRRRSFRLAEQGRPRESRRRVMKVRAFANAPVALGAVVWSAQRTTLIAKAAFALRDDGTFEIEAWAEPLALDTFDERGELVYPTDFAPYKPACDVVVGGRDALERQSAGQLIIGSLVCNVEPAESLGPRESFCPCGDPSSPEVQSTWMDGRMEFSRFQSAGPRQRMPWPEGPLQVELIRAPLSQRARWLGPLPSLVLEEPGGTRRPIAMRLDTIILLQGARRMIGVWRAIVDTPTPGEHRVYVHMGAPERGDSAAWSEVALALPSLLRAPVPSQPGGAPRAPVDHTVVAGGHAPMAWPFAGQAAADEPMPDHLERTRAVAVRTPARTLPFRREEGAATGSRAAPSDFAALRAEGRAPVRPAAWDARETTSIASLSQPYPAAMISTAPAEPPPPVFASQAAPPPAFVPAPVAAPPAPLLASPPPDQRSGQEEAERERAMVEAVQREIWKGERPLATILSEHGITEPAWRALRKRAGKRG